MLSCYIKQGRLLLLLFRSELDMTTLFVVIFPPCLVGIDYFGFGKSFKQYFKAN